MRNAQPTDDEIDLLRLVANVWSLRVSIMLGMALGLTIASVFVLISKSKSRPIAKKEIVRPIFQPNTAALTPTDIKVLFQQIETMESIGAFSKTQTDDLRLIARLQSNGTVHFEPSPNSGLTLITRSPGGDKDFLESINLTDSLNLIVKTQEYLYKMRAVDERSLQSAIFEQDIKLARILMKIIQIAQENSPNDTKFIQQNAGLLTSDESIGAALFAAIPESNPRRSELLEQYLNARSEMALLSRELESLVKAPAIKRFQRLSKESEQISPEPYPGPPIPALLAIGLIFGSAGGLALGSTIRYLKNRMLGSNQQALEFATKTRRDQISG